MWLETNRLIIRSIQRGDEIIFSGMSQDGSLSQVGFHMMFCLMKFGQ